MTLVRIRDHPFRSSAIFSSYFDYGLSRFQLEIFFPKNEHTQRKLLNFEFWINSELRKTGHHLVFFNEIKIEKDSDEIDIEN